MLEDCVKIFIIVNFFTTLVEYFDTKMSITQRIIFQKIKGGCTHIPNLHPRSSTIQL